MLSAATYIFLLILFIIYLDPYERKPSLASAHGYRSVLQIYPSPVSGDAWIAFRKKVLKYLQLEPFNSMVPDNVGTSDIVVSLIESSHLYNKKHNKMELAGCLYVIYVPVSQVISRCW